MFIYLSPQIGSNQDKITYTFSGETIEVAYRGITDTFDFTGMPLGETTAIETDLEINPILHAERNEQGLFVKLLNFVWYNATPEENFPDWIEVGNNG